MKPAERFTIPRQRPIELDPQERIKNFEEVTAGFSEETAILEANRCLQCKKPTCRSYCPVHNDIPGFIKLLSEGQFEKAYWKVRETSTMPAVCSRVCPHENQCEKKCIRKNRDESVSIGMLERFLADWMVTHKKPMAISCQIPNGKKVAIVGSGPAGMSAAYYLAHRGYSCTIFESLPVFGGMLATGIPHYRLPRDIIGAELAALKNCGVEIVYGTCVGRDKTLSQLQEEGYGAVFLGLGAHLSLKLGIEGEDAGIEGVTHGVDYLRRVLLGTEVELGAKVVVVGGGNVAIDVARTALRTGSDQVFILYRRTKEEMPASNAEIHHLEEEGVRVEYLAAPIKIHHENNKVTGIECVRMVLGEPDPSGRRRPVEQADSNFIIEADAIIPAISQKVDHTADQGVTLSQESWGTYEINPATMQTSIEWIFAGGDAVLGPQTVAKAIYQGKVAAESIQLYLEGKDLQSERCFHSDGHL